MTMETNELQIPEAVTKASRSMEMARIWIADGQQVVALSPNLWSDPGNWGLMFVDIARHLARQYAGIDMNEAEVLSRIRSAFDAEWAHPTNHEAHEYRAAK